MFKAIAKTLAPILFFTAINAFAWDATPFDRRQAVLEHFNASDYFESQQLLVRHQNVQSLHEFLGLLSQFDSQNEFRHYAEWTDNLLVVYQDRDTKQIEDFRVQLAPQALPSAPIPSDIRELRVALDPGHFGDEKDLHMGKFVRVGNTTLLEGRIALQTCFLVKKKLMALGVPEENIMITRTQAGGVTDISYEDFPTDIYGRVKLSQTTDEPWFYQLINRATSLTHLLNLFENSDEVSRLFPARNSGRWNSTRTIYYAHLADLDARSEKINRFNPHATIIIHYDLASVRGEVQAMSGSVQRSVNHVKAFIPGQVLADELGNREERYHLTRALLDTQKWVDSGILSKQLVAGISQSTGAPVAGFTSYMDRGRAVHPGVFTRNLRLNRTITETRALSYVEALFYNHADEFRRLTNESETSTVSGIQFTHSRRVDEVASGIVNGLERFTTRAAVPSITLTPESEVELL